MKVCTSWAHFNTDTVFSTVTQESSHKRLNVQPRANITYKPTANVRLCSQLLLRCPRTVTGRSVDFNLLGEDMTASLPAKYFHNHAQVRTGNHQRTVSVFLYHKCATVGVQGLAVAGV